MKIVNGNIISDSDHYSQFCIVILLSKGYPQKGYDVIFLLILERRLQHWIIARELGIDFIKATKLRSLYFLQPS